MHDGKVYGVPHVWGTSGLIVNRKAAGQVADYTDLCNTNLNGAVSYRLKRPTLIGFAFAMGEDPFAAYDNKTSTRPFSIKSKTTNRMTKAMLKPTGAAVMPCLT
eukprot:TRINITY_DN27090_c0_g1_i1.p1 TRINITY_DN27090_c0_g1~~TRINITY_DN27090_c0_g1_i1.p1  ORF type:complete len:104 (+),score=4.98 TRINITY_DN27090_c0_g1_i1:188-499(+)